MDRERLVQLFETVNDTGALIVKPATDDEIEMLGKDITLPAEYIEFLKFADGFSWNGFEFFGVYIVTVNSSGYTLKSVVVMNETYKTRKFAFEGKILLGRFDDDIYVWDEKDGLYKALDSLTMIEIESYEHFDDLFYDVVSEYAFYEDDEYDEEENLTEDDGNADQ